MKNISRRSFLKGMSAAAGAATLASLGISASAEQNAAAYADTIAWKGRLY